MVRTALIAALQEHREVEHGRGRECLSGAETSLEARPSGIVLAPPVRTTLRNNLVAGAHGSLRRVAVARVVRPLRYWFDRVVIMSRDNARYWRPQCRMSRHVRRTSVSTGWPRGIAHPAVRPGRETEERITRTSFPANVRPSTSPRSPNFGGRISVPLRHAIRVETTRSLCSRELNLRKLIFRKASGIFREAIESSLNEYLS